MKIFSFLLFQSLIFHLTFAQKVKIAVKVVDEHGAALPYTTVMVLHGKTGTMAGKYGNLTLTVNKGDSLRFTRIGFSEFHYGITKGGSITVQLEQTSFSAIEDGLCLKFHNPSSVKGKVIEEKLNEEVYKQPSNSLGAESLIFTKVEINPAMCSKKPVSKGFAEKINAAYVKKEGIFEIQFSITGDKKMDSIKIIKSYNNKVDQALIGSLKKDFIYYPAIQNGGLVAVRCEMQLNIWKSGGKVFIEFNNVK
jgi:hypothetical protein